MKLRDYQERVIHELRDGFRSGHMRQILALATGSGKTVVASHLIHNAARKGHKSLFIVDRVELIEQAVTHLDAMGLRVGVLQGENTFYTGKDDAVVASIQTIRARSAPLSGFVIIDECHLLHRAHIELMHLWNAVPFIGLSATPIRKDLGKYFTNLVRGPSVEQLTMEGALVPVKAFCPSREMLNNALADVSIRKGDFVEKELSQVLNSKKLIGDIVKTWLEKAEGRKTLCFSVDVAHSKSIVEDFIEAGIPAVHVDGYMQQSERDEIIQAFRDGVYIILSSVNVLGIGFDVPEVGCGILARPTLSEALDMQQKGRLIRPWNGKENAIILDHAGNCVRFGLPIHFSVPDLHDEDRQTAVHKRSQKKMATCQDCGALLEPSQENCPDCGSIRPIRKGDVEHLQEANLIGYGSNDSGSHEPTDEDRKRWYQGFKWYTETRGKKSGYAFFLFQDKFKSKPPFLWASLPSVEADPDVMRWIKYRNIRYAKRRKPADY